MKHLCDMTDEELYQFINEMRTKGNYTTAQGALAEAVMRLLQVKATLNL